MEALSQWERESKHARPQCLIFLCVYPKFKIQSLKNSFQIIVSTGEELTRANSQDDDELRKFEFSACKKMKIL